MFGAKPTERATQEEVAEFEAYAAKDLRQKLVKAGWDDKPLSDEGLLFESAFIASVLSKSLLVRDHHEC